MVYFFYFSLGLLLLVFAAILPLLTMLLFLWARHKKRLDYSINNIGVYRNLEVDLLKGKRGLKRIFWKIIDWWY